MPLFRFRGAIYPGSFGALRGLRKKAEMPYPAPHKKGERKAAFPIRQAWRIPKAEMPSEGEGEEGKRKDVASLSDAEDKGGRRKRVCQ